MSKFLIFFPRPTRFRFVGVGDPSDYTRLDTWVDRIAKWKEQGLQEVDFIIHEEVPRSAVEMSRHFIKKLNARIGTDLIVPKTIPRAVRKDGELFA